MTGLNLSISMTDLGAVAVLDALANADTHPLLDEIGAYLDSQVAKRFRDGVDPEGNPWPVSGRAAAEGGKTLVDTNRLASSITHTVSADGSFLEHGTNVLYAAIHQFGGTIRPKSGEFLKFRTPGGGFAQVRKVEIPARPFIGIGPEEAAEIPLIATHWAEELINAAG